MNASVLGGVALLFGAVIFLALKVNVARSHSKGSGGGAPVLDGAILSPLLAVWGFSLLAPNVGVAAPFRGFWFVAWLALTLGTGALLARLARHRPSSS